MFTSSNSPLRTASSLENALDVSNMDPGVRIAASGLGNPLPRIRFVILGGEWPRTFSFEGSGVSLLGTSGSTGIARLAGAIRDSRRCSRRAFPVHFTYLVWGEIHREVSVESR